MKTTPPAAALDRRRFLTMSAVFGGAAALGGCSTLGQIDTAVTDLGGDAQAALAAACKWEPTASAAWSLIRATGLAPVVVVAGATAAFAVLDTACKTPPTDLTTTLISVDNAINTIMAAISQPMAAKRAMRGSLHVSGTLLRALSEGRALQDRFAPLVPKRARRFHRRFMR